MRAGGQDDARPVFRQMAAHDSPRITKLYGRRSEVSMRWRRWCFENAIVGRMLNYSSIAFDTRRMQTLAKRGASLGPAYINKLIIGFHPTLIFLAICLAAHPFPVSADTPKECLFVPTSPTLGHEGVPQTTAGPPLDPHDEITSIQVTFSTASGIFS